MPNDFFKSGPEKKRTVFYDFYFDKNVVLVQWNNNQVVCGASNFAGVQPIKAIKRFGQRQKRDLMFLSPTAS